jgi:hypothetical protein
MCRYLCGYGCWYLGPRCSLPLRHYCHALTHREIRFFSSVFFLFMYALACSLSSLILSFFRFCNSPASQRWQYTHSAPLEQPPGFQFHAQGLHCLDSCSDEPCDQVALSPVGGGRLPSLGLGGRLPSLGLGGRLPLGLGGRLPSLGLAIEDDIAHRTRLSAGAARV